MNDEWGGRGSGMANFGFWILDFGLGIGDWGKAGRFGWRKDEGKAKGAKVAVMAGIIAKGAKERKHERREGRETVV